MADTIALFPDKKQKSAVLLRKVLWTAIIILIIFCLAELFFHFFVAPRILIGNILIESDIPFTEQEILHLAGISRKEYYFLISTEEIQEKLLAHPLVREARVEKVFPDTLKLKLLGRAPLMLALVNLHNSTIPVTVDEDGVIFQIGNNVSNWNLPVLSGLRFEKVDLGLKLPREIVPFLQDFKKLSDQNPGVAGLVSEIKIVKTETNDFEFIIFPLAYKKGVRVGRKIDAARMKYLLIALNLLEQEGTLAKTTDLDFRSGELVYRIKEE